MLNADLIDDVASLQALSEEWWSLWKRCPAATPFQSPAWLIAWWRSFAPGQLATIAIRVSGRLVALAPLYIEHGTERRLLPLGIGISDYLDVLIAPEAGETAAAEVARSVVDVVHGWDRWELEELSPDAVGRTLPCPAGCFESVFPQAVCPTLLLQGEQRSCPSHRHSRLLRLARNRADRLGGMKFALVGQGDITSFLDDLVRLHNARWRSRGENGVLSDARVVAFHRQVASELVETGLAQLYVGMLRGRVVTAIYALASGSRVLLYLTAFDPEEAFVSPGALLLAHVIAEAERADAREFHFLRGREPYKYEWGAIERINLKRSFVRS